MNPSHQFLLKCFGYHSTITDLLSGQYRLLIHLNIPSWKASQDLELSHTIDGYLASPIKMYIP
jgi:hypothetical protein